MCDWFEAHVKQWLEARKDPATAYKLNLAILVPRRVGKSTIFTKAGLMWIALQDPEASCYIGSEKAEFAEDFLQPVKEILKGNDGYAKFPWLYGIWYDTSREWKRGYVVHAARKNAARGDPSFGTWGVKSGLTSKHPDILCLDDPTSYEKMGGDANWLFTVNEHIASLEPVIEKDGLMIWVGTRYSDGDHFGNYFRLEGVKSVAGMRMPNVPIKPDGKWNVYFIDARDPDNNDIPTCPSIWSDADLVNYEKQHPIRYMAQVRNNPTTSKFSPITREDILGYIVDPGTVSLKGLWVSIHIDTAFKKLVTQVRGDETVIVMWGHLRNGTGDVVYLGGYGSNYWQAEDLLVKLVWCVQDMRMKGARVRMITDEPELGGKIGAWELLIRNYFNDRMIPCPPINLLPRGSQQKVARLTIAADFWKDGHVKLLRDAPGLEPLIDQMSKIGASMHDDWADAAADVFHKDVYQQMSMLESRAQTEEIGHPMDSILKGTPNIQGIYDYLQDSGILDRYSNRVI